MFRKCSMMSDAQLYLLFIPFVVILFWVLSFFLVGKKRVAFLTEESMMQWEIISSNMTVSLFICCMIFGFLLLSELIYGFVIYVQFYDMMISFVDNAHMIKTIVIPLFVGALLIKIVAGHWYLSRTDFTLFSTYRRMQKDSSRAISDKKFLYVIFVMCFADILGMAGLLFALQLLD